MSEAAVRVRRARIEEIRELAEEYREESSRTSADGRPWLPPIPQGGLFWIAEDDDGPLGYAAGPLRPEGMTIGPMFVRPDARRQGVARRLLTAIQDWAEGARVPLVEVSVAVDNDAGRAFLESAGYVQRRIMYVRGGTERARGER